MGLPTTKMTGESGPGQCHLHDTKVSGIWRTLSKVRRRFGNFFDDFWLLGVTQELLDHLKWEKRSKGWKRVPKGRQNGGSEVPPGAPGSRLGGLWSHIGPLKGPAGVTIGSSRRRFGPNADF